MKTKNLILSLILFFVIVACRQSAPNPILGTWVADSNLVEKIVFSDSVYLHSCKGKKGSFYTIENNGKELRMNEQVYFLYFFDNKLRISQNEKRVILTKVE